jgi:membrane-associated protease RseP (regulator of RpoE activity)
MTDIIKIIVALAVIILIIAVGPLLTIWAVNTLFPTVAIPYTIETWFSVVVLGTFFRAKVNVKK